MYLAMHRPSAYRETPLDAAAVAVNVTDRRFMPY
jgi:hypothetical protein